MSKKLTIHIDRLHKEKSEPIEETLSPSFINVDESDLKFTGSIEIKGKTYLAEEHLVIQLKIQAQFSIPCSICNEPAETLIKLRNYYQTEELSQIKGQIYNYMPALREAILLEVPFFVECKGNCPKRTELNKYLREEKKNPKIQERQVNFPFADLK